MFAISKPQMCKKKKKEKKMKRKKKDTRRHEQHNIDARDATIG
jgi:hypothetical protein